MVVLVTITGATDCETPRAFGVGGLVLLWQEQEQRPGRQGLRAGAELRLRLRAVLQEQENLPGRQGQGKV